jgi:phage shock protein E
MKKTIIDVRTPEEFALGHVEGSMNIPLQHLSEHIDELQHIEDEIVLCCASGARSAKAYRMLQHQGFGKISNGGPWMDVMKAFVNS